MQDEGNPPESGDAGAPIDETGEPTGQASTPQR
jgi:hypothetical protein